MAQHQEHKGHQHGAVSAEQAASTAFIVGIGLNMAYVLVEAGIGFYQNSLALLTDAGHNLSDVVSLALSLVALRLARRKPTARFTYGYKKTTILSALLNAVILLVAVGILGYEAVLRLRNPEPVAGGTMAWVAGIGIAVNTASALLFLRNKHELNSKSAYLHLIADAAVSAGVVVAGIIIRYTDWYWLDAVMSLAVIVVILFSTWTLLTDSLRLSLDAVPRNVNMDEVMQALQRVKGVANVSHVHVWAISTTENALTAHVSLAEGYEQHTTLASLKHELEHHNIQHATIEIDHKSSESTALCEPEIL